MQLIISPRKKVCVPKSIFLVVFNSNQTVAFWKIGTLFLVKKIGSLLRKPSVYSAGFENFTNTYDLVFADPPYKFDDNKYQTIINYVLNNCLKNDNGIFILEHYKKYSFSENNNFFDERSYGDSKFSFFKKKSGI